MKWTFAVLLVAAAACGGGSETPEQRLIGKWLYTDASGTRGLSVQFDADSTYTLATMQLTSTTSAEAQVETGVFAATGTQITSTPQMYTCPGPYPGYQVSYHFNGDSLVVTYSTGVMAFSRNTAAPASNVVVTYGCFQSGAFVAAPLAAVSN
jgi:hypothetical protein